MPPPPPPPHTHLVDDAVGDLGAAHGGVQADGLARLVQHAVQRVLVHLCVQAWGERMGMAKG